MDDLATPQDINWLADQLSDNLIFKNEYKQTHMSFVLAKDMKWFSQDAMAVLNYSNGKCDP